jgi:hypothetical protein
LFREDGVDEFDRATVPHVTPVRSVAGQMMCSTEATGAAEYYDDVIPSLRRCRLHAEFLVRHAAITQSSLKDSLTSRFYAENRDALKESPLFDSGKWDDVVLYATQTPSFRLLCVPMHDAETQVYVEPVSGNIISICESVWAGTQNALRSAQPRLESVKLVDNDSGKEFLTARPTGLGPELKRRENLAPVAVGSAVVVYAAVGVATFAADDGAKFLAGAVAGIISAIVAIVLAVVAAKKGRLLWSQ